ncbi:SUN domain-containing ossification factor [Adelges cooleyi]|uniref:SUN domain-containing ossification factor n=1 Tax=Adelges cooleyi TaxID=133065 RepID=UPI00217F79E9|nr:SUN domain-containing ossification factor [Adelges cooleyi]XP_050430892.1 SUN domain-containing ossification factor [Adelges cooleyi]
MSFNLIPVNRAFVYFILTSIFFRPLILTENGSHVIEDFDLVNENNEPSIFLQKTADFSNAGKTYNYKRRWKSVLLVANTCTKNVFMPEFLTNDSLNERLLSNISDSLTHDVPLSTIFMTKDNISAHYDESDFVKTDVLEHHGGGNQSENATGSVRNVTVNEDIPSFREWTKKQLEEAEKQPAVNETKFKRENKILKKNYASPECGAKVVSTNPEAMYPYLLLTLPTDEYMLNLCKSTTWFVVELCEAIQVKKIELANFELFSSTPKDFSVYVATRLNARNWTPIARLVAEDVRTLQGFHLNTTDDNAFTKYIKVEIHSHYGKEHYCPISVFNAYGLSEFEALERADDPGLESQNAESEDVDDLDIEDENVDSDQPNKNTTNSKNTLLDSARVAVMSIVKIATNVLDMRQKPTCDVPPCSFNKSTENPTEEMLPSNCITPGYIMVCHGCDDAFYKKMFDTISCEADHLTELYRNKYIHDTIMNSGVCTEYGLDLLTLKNKVRQKNKSFIGKRSETFLLSIFPRVKIAALCNTLAIVHKKIVLNKAKRVYISDNLIINLQTAVPELNSQNNSNNNSNQQQTDDSSEVTTPLESKSSTLDLSSFIEPLVSQILPTKTLANTEEPVISLSHQMKETANVHVENLTVDTPSDPEPNATNESPMPSSTQYLANSIIDKPIIAEVQNSLEENATSEAKAASEQPADNFDSFFKDFEAEESESDKCNPTTSESSVHYTTVQQSSVQSQNTKQSLFIRLANRIKDLERNMSLSGEYLQELSTRYKKQVDDMQRTILELAEENRLKREQDFKIFGEMKILSEQVATLQSTLHCLKAETENLNIVSLFLSENHPFTVMVLCLIVIVYTTLRMLGYLGKRGKELEWDNSIKASNTRRQSTNDILSNIKEKHRRPSEEALFSSGTTHQDLLIRNSNGDNVKTERKRRRKRKELILKSKSNAINLEAGGMDNGGNIKLQSTASHNKLPRSASSSDLTVCNSSSHDFMKTALSVRTIRMSSSSMQSDKSFAANTNKNTTEIKSKSIKHFLKRMF